MKILMVVFIMIMIPLLVVNCTNSTETKNSEKELTITTDRQKSSYSVGFGHGVKVRTIANEVDLDFVVQGFVDAVFQNNPKIPESQLRDIYSKFQRSLDEKRRRELQAMAEKNKIEGEQFLKENATKEGIIVTKSGLQYRVLQEGTGPIPKETDTVKVHYRGTLINGTEVINTYTRGEPVNLPLQRVILAWKEGFQLMKVGSKYHFFIPPGLAYGERGAAPLVPPNSTLVYEVELLAIEPPYNPENKSK